MKNKRPLFAGSRSGLFLLVLLGAFTRFTKAGRQASCHSRRSGHARCWLLRIDRSAHAPYRPYCCQWCSLHSGLCPHRVLSVACGTSNRPASAAIRHQWTQGNMKGPDGINMRWKRSRSPRHSRQLDTEPRCLANGMSDRTAIMDRRSRDLMNSLVFATDSSITSITISFTEKAITTSTKAPRRFSKTGSIFLSLSLSGLCSLSRETGNHHFSSIWVSMFHTIRNRHSRNIASSTRMIRRSYAAITTTTDHYIGLVLKKLDDLKLTENTIVILQSDNGHSVEDKNAINNDGAACRKATVVAGAIPGNGLEPRAHFSKVAFVFPRSSVGLQSFRRVSLGIRRSRSWTGFRVSSSGAESKISK